MFGLFTLHVVRALFIYVSVQKDAATGYPKIPRIKNSFSRPGPFYFISKDDLILNRKLTFHFLTFTICRKLGVFPTNFTALDVGFLCSRLSDSTGLAQCIGACNHPPQRRGPVRRKSKKHRLDLEVIYWWTNCCFCSILDDPNKMTKCEKVVLFHQNSKSYNVLRTPLLRTGSHISVYTTSWSYGWPFCPYNVTCGSCGSLVCHVLYGIFRPGSVQCHHGRLPSRATWRARRNADTIHLYILFYIYIYIYTHMICIYIHTDYVYDLYIPIPPTYTDMICLYTSSIYTCRLSYIPSHDTGWFIDVE